MKPSHTQLRSVRRSLRRGNKSAFTRSASRAAVNAHTLMGSSYRRDVDIPLHWLAAGIAFHNLMRDIITAHLRPHWASCLPDR
jgi:hypothetical protein